MPRAKFYPHATPRAPRQFGLWFKRAAALLCKLSSTKRLMCNILLQPLYALT